MTVSVQPLFNDYVGNGSVTSFTYTFQIGSSTDLQVYVDDVLQSTGFTVSGAGNPAGGAVVFSAAPTVGAQVALRRQTALDRVIDYTEGAALPSDTFDADIDRVVRQVQDVDFTLRELITALSTRISALEGGV